MRRQALVLNLALWAVIAVLMGWDTIAAVLVLLGFTVAVI
jgi:hypothetical protein